MVTGNQPTTTPPLKCCQKWHEKPTIFGFRCDATAVCSNEVKGFCLSWGDDSVIIFGAQEHSFLHRTVRCDHMSLLSNLKLCGQTVQSLVDVSDISYFSRSGEGRRSPRRQAGRGGGRFLLKIPGGGVLQERGQGAEGPGECLRGIFVFFFSGPKFPRCTRTRRNHKTRTPLEKQQPEKLLD